MKLWKRPPVRFLVFVVENSYLKVLDAKFLPELLKRILLKQKVDKTKWQNCFRFVTKTFLTHHLF